MIRLGWVQADGELLDGLVLRSEVEVVVLTELSVRKTLGLRAVWMQGSGASFAQSTCCNSAGHNRYRAARRNWCPNHFSQADSYPNSLQKTIWISEWCARESDLSQVSAPCI